MNPCQKTLGIDGPIDYCIRINGHLSPKVGNRLEKNWIASIAVSNDFRFNFGNETDM
jgi:hypothetical protein